MIYSALKLAKKEIVNGSITVNLIKSHVRRQILDKTSGRMDYVEVLDAGSLKPIKKTLRGRIIIATAVKFHKARLIDNIIFPLN